MNTIYKKIIYVLSHQSSQISLSLSLFLQLAQTPVLTLPVRSCSDNNERQQKKTKKKKFQERTMVNKRDRGPESKDEQQTCSPVKCKMILKFCNFFIIWSYYISLGHWSIMTFGHLHMVGHECTRAFDYKYRTYSGDIIIAKKVPLLIRAKNLQYQ